MARAIAYRLFQVVLVMMAVTAIAFMMFRFVGDPVTMMVREDASASEKEHVRRSLGLDRPVLVQYFSFLGRVAQGDLGVSFHSQRPVAEMISERAPATLELVGVATILALLVGVPLGVVCALRPEGGWARLVQVTSIVGISMPTFVIGIGLILIFAVGLRWLPSFGRGELVPIGNWNTGLLTRTGLASLILPAITLSLYQMTLIMRLVRAEMIDVLSSDFIRFAKARGLPPRYIHYRLALRNALLPVVTVMGMQIGSMIAFAIVTETVFQWPGMGLLFIQAVGFIDTPVMAAYLLFVGFLFVAINTIVDLTYVLIDPRLRTRGT